MTTFVLAYSTLTPDGSKSIFQQFLGMCGREDCFQRYVHVLYDLICKYVLYSHHFLFKSGKTGPFIILHHNLVYDICLL